jgi:type IV pilus assembly protein PilC
MANFSYKAVDQNKHIVQGQLSGKTRDEIAHILEKRGLATLVIKPLMEISGAHGSLPVIEKITFCRYLSIMLSTGLSLSEGIDVLRRETKNPLMAKILGDMTYSLEQGQDLSSIFERYPTAFEPYFITLTRAGEMSGKLSDVFKYLESELRSEYSLNSKVKGALMYPTIVFSAMIVMGIGMFFFILPQIGRVFLSMNMPLAAPTKFLFTSSIALSKQVVPIITSIVILGVIGFFSLKNPVVKDMLLAMVRPIPMIHNLLQEIDLARFNRIFSTLIRSAVPITDALEISFMSLTLKEYKACAKTFPDEIKRGRSFSELVKANHSFPSLMVQMVIAGEKTATLDSTLSDLAGFYESEVEEQVKGLTQIIEPILMLCVGIGVGALILSIIGPIYSVVGSMQTAGAAAGPR